MKRIPKPVFFIVAILILLFAFTSLAGVRYYEGDIPKTVIKGIGDIRWGIDIRGGVEATFKPVEQGAKSDGEAEDTGAATGDEATVDEAVIACGKKAGEVAINMSKICTAAFEASEDTTEEDLKAILQRVYDQGLEANITAEQLSAARSIIETRMVMNSITDYEIYSDNSNNCIIVRFPWKENDTDFDPVSAVDELAATAKLTFNDPDGNVVMDGSSVKKANPNYDEYGNAIVNLELTSDGAKIFADVTEQFLGKTISIKMDDKTISAPTVQSHITGGSAMITGLESYEEAAKLANQINGGALPFDLEVTSYSSISPTLGQNSLTAMGYAAIIAFALIAVFMIIRYRVPGVVAVLALIGQMALSVVAITRFFPNFDSFTMTLPGIAGIILSIGMGVDANIITAERIKEEFRNGKTLDSAIDRGTKNSLSAIIDGNMTIVIVSIILLLVFGPSNILSWIFGESTTGTIYAFGYTLLMGVISNFIMGVWLSRVMLKSVAGIKFLRKKWLFGGAGK